MQSRSADRARRGWLVAAAVAAGVLAALATAGCAVQKTIDEKIYRVVTPSGTNYYRVRIDAFSYNGVSEFKAGLYPAYAVNTFLGSEASATTEAASVESDLRKAVAEAQLAAFKKFVNAKTNETRAEAAAAIRELQSLPIPAEGSMGKDRVMLQYNPVRSLVDFSANKKHVIALSNDPDAILQQIQAFAEEPETQQALTNGIAGLVAASNGEQLSRTTRERERVRTAVMGLERLLETTPADADKARTQLEEILAYLEALE